MTQNGHTTPRDDDHWFQPVTEEQLAAQRQWELRGTQRAIRRYRIMVLDSSLTDTPPGQTILKDVVPKLTDLIKASQAEARSRIVNSTGGRPSPWWWMIDLLPADVMAVVVASSALNDVNGTSPFTSFCLHVTRVIQLEVEYGEWVKAERAETLEAKKAHQPYRNLAEALKWETRSIDARAVRSWWRKIKKMRDEPWERNDRIHFGAKLGMLLVEAGGGWFDLKNVPSKGGKTIKRLLLTDTARQAISNINERFETCVPLVSPMICRPIPWHRVYPVGPVETAPGSDEQPARDLGCQDASAATRQSPSECRGTPSD